MTDNTSQPIDILLTAPMSRVADALPKDSFRLHRLWEAADKDGFLREIGPTIRGIAASGNLPIDAALTDKLPALEIVSNFGVGYDRIDAKHAAAKGYMVTNTPDVLNEEVADLTLALLLATIRELPQSDRFVRDGKWTSGSYPLTASLRGRTVGIVGLGRIGKAIAKRLDAFGVPVAYHGRSHQKEVDRPYHSALLEMARTVDILIVCAPGGKETDKIVDAPVLQALGPHGILINVARGSLVDEPALIAALRDGTILAAGLDVFADEPRMPAEFFSLKNVVLLPHVGSASRVTRDAMGQLVADNLISWFQGRGPLTPVPETPYFPE